MHPTGPVETGRIMTATTERAPAARVLTAYAVIKSKRLADLLDALSDESLSPRQRLRAIFGSWRRSP